MVSFQLILSVLLFSIFMYHFQWLVSDLRDSLPWLTGKIQKLIDIMKTVAADIHFK